MSKTSAQEDLDSAHSSSYSSSDSEQTRGASKSEEGTSITLAPGQTLPGTKFSISNYKEMASTVSRYHGVWNGDPSDILCEAFEWAQKLQPSFPSAILEAQDIIRWRMAWQAIEKYDRLDGHVCRRSKDMLDRSDILDDNLLILGFSITAFVYGGLHALAWPAHFKSSTEQLLWRISAAMVMGAFPVGTGIYKIWDRIIQLRPSGGAYDTILTILSFLILLAYIVARTYLVVECFINLKHLPAGVYNVPQWSSYFPHIA